MKKTLAAFAFVAVFAACKNEPKQETSTTVNTDTIAPNQGLLTDTAQTVNMNGVSDTIIASDGNQYVKVVPDQPAAVVPVAKTPAKRKTSKSSSSTKSSSSSSSSGSGTASSSGGSSTGETGTASTPVPEKKKGWSKAAKGTAIGAGTGAVAGAIISKKKGKGAVIGGLIGGAGGYIIGRSKDKKDGRVQ